MPISSNRASNGMSPLSRSILNCSISRESLSSLESLSLSSSAFELFVRAKVWIYGRGVCEIYFRAVSSQFHQQRQSQGVQCVHLPSWLAPKRSAYIVARTCWLSSQFNPSQASNFFLQRPAALVLNSLGAVSELPAAFPLHPSRVPSDNVTCTM